MTPTIVFHIGLEKTGTSSFQRFCWDNRRPLLRHRVLYPANGLACAGRSHRPLVAAYLPYCDVNIGPRRPSAEVMRALHDEIDAAKPETVLISAEHFSSRCGDAEVTQLAQDFAGYPCRIAVVVRAHCARIHSAYAQTIASGRTLTFDAYCNELLDPPNRYARYRETITVWQRTFGSENTSVFLLMKGMNAVGLLAERLLPRSALVGLNMSYSENKSSSARAVEILRRVNLALPSHDPLRTDVVSCIKWLLLGFARDRIHDLISTIGDRSAVGFHMSAHNRERLQEIIGADREWLAANYRIEL